MEKFTDTETLEELAVWSERSTACRSSGISLRVWCEGNGISTTNYYNVVLGLHEYYKVATNVYVLLYKWLSNGRFQWPRSETKLRHLDLRSFR